MNFSDHAVARRTRKGSFYAKISEIIDFTPISAIIDQHYFPGKSATGRYAYDGLLLFKMLLVGIFESLSDYGVEDKANSDLNIMLFCGLSLEDDVPDHSVLSRFRSHLTKIGNNVFEDLLNEINRQLKEHKIIAHNLISIDASLTASPHRYHLPRAIEIITDRRDETYPETVITEVIKGDSEATWVKKGKRAHFGFKQNTAVDENGMVIALVTTTASKNDTVSFPEVLEKAVKAETLRVFADKGYASKKNSDLLSEKTLKNGIQKKASKGKKLSKRAISFNKGVSKKRVVVERTFGIEKLWLGARTTRYKGIAKTHTFHLLVSIAHNLKRAPMLLLKQLMRDRFAKY